jgi:hypothetical protein
MAKMDLMDLKDRKLDEVLDELRAAAANRAAELLGEGRVQARRALGAHDEGALFSALTIGIVAGALVGAALALLVTPMSGAEARRKIANLRSRQRAEPSWESASTGNGHPAAPEYSDVGR